ncbi:YlxR family protein [Erysipelotrichaceae bacterium OH741_COT-311]|nr:YlxR family protein [Erysipelotrichaceae bacterium OH741_COT-311]
MKKIPMRKCVATNQQFPKKELIRIVKTPTGELKVDLTGKLNGKGAYIQNNLDALNIAIKKGSINRALDVVLTEEVIEELKSIILNGSTV